MSGHRHGRGQAIWLAGAALALAATTPCAIAAPVAELFVPPEGPMLLTRTLRRPLPDGREVVARRSYEVRFVAEGGGYRIDGKLVDVAVEAPEVLRPLAEIERIRPDTGMFPMRLDARGRLLPGGDPQSGEAVGRAVELVSGELGRMKLAALDMMQAQAFVGQFRRNPGQSQWPLDLFRPAPGRHSETRAIPLPNGARGQVAIEIDARGDGPAGLLSSLSRTVVTDLDGDRRTTFESWTLAPAR